MTLSNDKLNEIRARDNYPRFYRFVRFQHFLKHFTILTEDECWEWQGATAGKGYGQFHYHKTQYAHVSSYLFFIGSIPKRRGKKKLFVCHSCDNPLCVNPKHLWLGTHQQNMDDMVNKGRQSHSLGEDASQSKLNTRKVLKIRRLYKTGKYSYSQLGKRYNVAISTIQHIVERRNWKHV